MCGPPKVQENIAVVGNSSSAICLTRSRFTICHTQKSRLRQDANVANPSRVWWLFPRAKREPVISAAIASLLHGQANFEVPGTCEEYNAANSLLARHRRANAAFDVAAEMQRCQERVHEARSAGPHQHDRPVTTVDRNLRTKSLFSRRSVAPEPCRTV